MANSNDYFKKGLEISKGGQIFKRNSANEDDPQMTRLSEDSPFYKLGTVLAKKIKKDKTIAKLEFKRISLLLGSRYSLYILEINSEYVTKFFTPFNK